MYKPAVKVKAKFDANPWEQVVTDDEESDAWRAGMKHALTVLIA
jgi:hypothetical protein